MNMNLILNLYIYIYIFICIFFFFFFFLFFFFFFFFFSFYYFFFTIIVIKIIYYNRYQGHIGAALILGGVDCTGPHLYTIYPHGSTDKLPYVTMGSGSLAAMAVFESKYKANLEVYSFYSLIHFVLL